MSIQVEAVEGEDAAREFALFHDRVYAGLPARWPAHPELQVALFLGESPNCREREILPLVARRGGEIAARAAAVVDARYNRHWNERIGHVVMFEALDDADELVKPLLDQACGWLAERGMQAARAGFCFGTFELPFRMDAYDVLPPSMLRQNPSSYHRMLKRAGFEVEKGMVDYKLRVTPELEQRWESSLAQAKATDLEIVPLRDLEPSQRVHDLTDTWADTFAHHWGFVAFDEAEIAGFLAAFAETTLLDTSCLAYLAGEPVGFLFDPSDVTEQAILAPGRALDAAEKLNLLGIGVRERVRGRGINYAMAAYSYLELVRRGRTHLSYTFVLDDNWPSRRTGEGLGAEVCANYLAYRRSFRR